jgi:predicted lipoprotein with Yx(FWY)xxD motif
MRFGLRQRVVNAGLSTVAVVMSMAVVFGVAVAASARSPRRGVTIGSIFYRDYVEAQLVTWNGTALVTFSRDKHRSSRCVGRCSRAWVPVITSGRPRTQVGSQVRSRRLGTIRRPDGRLQATYYGRPLYRPRGRKQERAIACTGFSNNHFGGTFSLITPAGDVPVGRCAPY